VLAFTAVRTHGLLAVTNPERVAEVQAEAQVRSAPAIRAVTGGGTTTIPAVGEAKGHDAADAAPRHSVSPGAERTLAALVGIATLAGVGSMLLLPAILTVAFVTSLVRAPRATAATMGAIIWSLFLVGMVLPWSSLWPQLPWPGLFLGYADLVAEVEAMERASGPFAIGPLLVHVGMPVLAVSVLVGIAWRCGEALHAELLSAESLSVDPAIERDAAGITARGASVAPGRNAASFAMATGSLVPDMPATSELDEAERDEPPRRRLI